MKKRLIALLAAGVLSLSAAVPAMAAGWVKDSTGWWYQNENGSYPASQWSYINGAWYYFGPSGYILNGWQQIGGSWYYLQDSGAMAANCWVGNYYLGSSGAMLTNTVTPDGYHVGADGAWIQSAAPMEISGYLGEDPGTVQTQVSGLTHSKNEWYEAYENQKVGFGIGESGSIASITTEDSSYAIFGLYPGMTQSAAEQILKYLGQKAWNITGPDDVDGEAYCYEASDGYYHLTMWCSHEGYVTMVNLQTW